MKKSLLLGLLAASMLYPLTYADTPAPNTVKSKILLLQKLGRDAKQEALAADKEAADSRTQLSNVKLELNDTLGQLQAADANSDRLQAQIDVQTNQLANAIDEKNAAVAHDQATTKRNAKLANIIAGEAAIVVLLVLLYLGVPSLSPPWGLVGTILSIPIIFFSVKLILEHI